MREAQLAEVVRELMEEIEKLKKVVEIQSKALEAHLNYAEELRADWSDYDGRTHLSVAESINRQALKEVKQIMGEM
jgi:hypothetical protein